MSFEGSHLDNNAENGEFREQILTLLEDLEKIEELCTLQDEANYLISYIQEEQPKFEAAGIDKETFIEQLRQIVGSHSIARSKYYLNRLIRSITKTRVGKINDIDMNRWKEYGHIKTDSLWYEEKRDRSGAHNAGYWGNFIPQIPRQLMMRFTKKGDWVLDTFSGSGTTLIECLRLGRSGIGIDLSKEAIDQARNNISSEENEFDARIELVKGDSTSLSFETVLSEIGVKSVQLVIMHPPYWDIIKFTEDKHDLSNASTEQEFLSGIRKIAIEARRVLDNGRYLAIVIGDKYSKGEWIPLGFRAMSVIMDEGFKLKSTVVKNFDSTRGKRMQKELWRYRALLGGFYVFKHEYIFLFQK